MIRQMDDRDLERILEIENQSFGKSAWTREDFLHERDITPFGRVVVYEDTDGDVAGYLAYWDFEDRAEITNLAVAEEKRCLGIASALLEWMIGLSADGDWQNITLEVRVGNQNAIRLYKRFGFEIWALKKNYYGTEDGYLMGKEDLG